MSAPVKYWKGITVKRAGGGYYEAVLQLRKLPTDPESEIGRIVSWNLFDTKADAQASADRWAKSANDEMNRQVAKMDEVAK